MLQMTFVNCIAILSIHFGGEIKFVLVAKVNKSLTRIFSEKISECFRINTNASKTWLKYRPYSLSRLSVTSKESIDSEYGLFKTLSRSIYTSFMIKGIVVKEF